MAVQIKTFKNKFTRTEIAFVFSLLFHVLCFYLLSLDSVKNRLGLEQRPEKKYITVSLEKRGESPRPMTSLGQQIVNTDQNGEKRRDENTRFLGETDQTFDRQTTAKIIGTFKEAGKGKQAATETESVEKEFAKRRESVAKSKIKPIKANGTKEISLSDLAITQHTPAEEQGADGAKGSAQGLENGKLGVSGFAKNNDYIEDLPLGDMTHINTAEFKYYSFYHRIRQKLEQHWGNSLRDKAEKLYRSGRRLPASENAITALVITIDDKGSIVDVFVKSTSGVKELDDAAIESFNKAGPFPNPPQGMVTNGKAEIEWGFVVKS